MIVRANAGATEGANYGFIVLRKGAETRRVPYLFLVTRPAFEGVGREEAAGWQTRHDEGRSRSDERLPLPGGRSAPPPGYTGAADERGRRRRSVYVTLVKTPIVNLGVAVIERSANSLIDPLFLGSPDQNDVQGYAGTPVNVNASCSTSTPISASPARGFPRQQRF